MLVTSRILAVVALFLYVPGILLPAMRLEKMGRVRETSLFDSFSILLNEREWLLAAVVGVSALLLPPVKLLSIVWLEAATGPGQETRRHSVALELVSRFGLLEVFLSALFIALVRFDAFVRFEARVGLYAFILSAVAGLGAVFLLHLSRQQEARP